MGVGDEDERELVAKTIGARTMTKGTLVSLLASNLGGEDDAAAKMVREAREADVIEEVRPRVFRVTEDWRDDRWPK